MRTRLSALAVAAALAACTRVPLAQTAPLPPFSVHDLPSRTTPSPLSAVQSGHVWGVVPKAWRARPLPGDGVSQEGFEASPRLSRFEHGDGAVQGIEAFWVDVAKERIPSNYYYLAARNEAISALTTGKSCRLASRQILVDHPPDFTGQTFSASDYVATANGTCDAGKRTTQWAYLVAAPGYGPVRDVGIPTSGLYVVIAIVSGHGENATRLLRTMFEGMRFGDTTVSQIMHVAGRLE